MELTPDQYTCKYIIRSYQPGELIVNAQTLNQSVMLFPEDWIFPWAPHNIAELTAEHLAPALAFKPEIFILGTGPSLQFPPPTFLLPFYEKKIGVECMDTGAACRVYHILMSENRKAVAGLLV